MCKRIRHRGIRTRPLTFFWTAATVVALGCGSDRAGPTGPDPADPIPTDPIPTGPASWPGPTPLGQVMYAVDLANNFLVFGSESGDVLSAKMKITGVPLLKRIIGIALRPSDGKLYGIGNDSRVYVIDPLTAHATPVSEDPFSPKIASFFDIHFAMDLEPNGDRVRLVAAESGGNWSISLDDGTAILQPNAKYAEGTPLERRTPALLGLVYPTLPDSAKQAGWCANLAYAIDADQAIMLASCDPATGQWWPTATASDASANSRVPTGSPSLSAAAAPKPFRDLKDQLLRCGEFMPSVEGSESPGEPDVVDRHAADSFRTPDTEFWVLLVDVGTASNRVGVVKPFDTDPFMLGVTFHWQIPSEEPIQSVEWVPQKYVPQQQKAVWAGSLRPVPGSSEPSLPVPSPASPGVHCG